MDEATQKIADALNGVVGDVLASYGFPRMSPDPDNPGHLSSIRVDGPKFIVDPHEWMVESNVDLRTRTELALAVILGVKLK